jgi:hypothetical protein
LRHTIFIPRHAKPCNKPRPRGTLGRVAVRGDLSNPLGDYFDLSLIQAGPMIAGAWIALRLTGRLHRERGWIDGLGTLVGALWVLIAMLFEFCLLAYG